jgi:hypothetical protein
MRGGLSQHRTLLTLMHMLIAPSSESETQYLQHLVGRMQDLENPLELQYCKCFLWSASRHCDKKCSSQHKLFCNISNATVISIGENLLR